MILQDFRPAASRSESAATALNPSKIRAFGPPAIDWNGRGC